MVLAFHQHNSSWVEDRETKYLLQEWRQILQPNTVNLKDLKQSAAKEKATQQKYYDREAGQDHSDPVRMFALPGTEQWLPALYRN